MKTKKLKLEKFRVSKLDNLSSIKGGSIHNITVTTDTDGNGGGGGGQTDDSILDTFDGQ